VERECVGWLLAWQVQLPHGPAEDRRGPAQQSLDSVRVAGLRAPHERVRVLRLAPRLADLVGVLTQAGYGVSSFPNSSGSRWPIFASASATRFSIIGQ